MSNVIKSQYVSINEIDKKYIDTNNKSEMFRIVHLEQNLRSHEPVDELAATSEGVFYEGIAATVVNVEKPVSSEESNRLSYEQVIEKANLEAEVIISQAKQKAVENSRMLYEETKEKGYKEGISKGREEIAQAKKELDNLFDKLNKEYEEQVTSLEPRFSEIVSLLVEKMTGIMVEDKKDVILYLIHNAIMNADVSKSFMIRTSKEDYEFVCSKKEELQSLVSNEVSLDFIRDNDLNKNQCMIETDSSVIDCSLDVELNNLVRDIKLLTITKA